MINIIYLILAGLISGVIGGMGMGGGTLLIPILSIFLGFAQKSAQGINLLVFIPMSLFALVVHIKNKLVEFKDLVWLILPAVLFAGGASLLASVIEGDLLKRIFGGFLIVLAFVQFFSVNDKKKEKTDEKLKQQK